MRNLRLELEAHNVQILLTVRKPGPKHGIERVGYITHLTSYGHLPGTKTDYTTK